MVIAIVQSNTSTCFASFGMHGSMFTVIIPMEHADTLVEQVGPNHTHMRFVNDLLHWLPTTCPNGTPLLLLDRMRYTVSNNMLERVGNVINRVFERNAALEALSGAAQELADEPPPDEEDGDTPPTTPTGEDGYTSMSDDYEEESLISGEVQSTPMSDEHQASFFNWDEFKAAFKTDSTLL